MEADDTRTRCEAAASSRIQQHANSATAIERELPTTSNNILEQNDIIDDRQQTLHSFLPWEPKDRSKFSKANQIIDLEAEGFQEPLADKELNLLLGNAGGKKVYGQQEFDTSMVNVTCPVCNREWKSLSNGELNQHVDSCLQSEVVTIN